VPSLPTAMDLRCAGAVVSGEDSIAARCAQKNIVGEGFEIAEVRRGDGLDNDGIERRVVVYGDVSESDHFREHAKSIFVDDLMFSENSEGMSGASW